MPSQLIIFLLLFGGVQGLLFSLFLLHKKLYRNGYMFLLAYLAVMMLQLTLKVMSKIWLMENWQVLYSVSYYLPLLYGPLAYLFVKHILQHRASTIKEWWHFVPVAIIFISIIIDNYQELPFKSGIVIFNPGFRLVLLFISLFAYHGLAFHLWRRHRQSLGNYFSDTSSLQTRWVKQFIVVSAIACSVLVVALYLLYIHYPDGYEYRYGFILLSICIYWFSYTALTKPAIFSVIKGYAPENNDTNFTISHLKVYKPKYANSPIHEEQVQQICCSLEKTMAEKKLFLRPELTISQLANELNCSRHHLSQVLNYHLKKSYYDYINCLRVGAARQVLEDEKYQQHKIASIAYDCGFNSLSTFNEVFKKHTGKTPSDYRKELLKEYGKQRV